MRLLEPPFRGVLEDMITFALFLLLEAPLLGLFDAE
jgi:hypothetical protein